MTTHEAKQILALHRPDAAEAPEPEVVEALTLVRKDPELKHWYEEYRAVQHAIRDRFVSITPPAGLREQIISECNARRKIVWWRQPAALAVAAMLLVCCLSAGVMWVNSQRTAAEEISFQTFRQRMVKSVSRGYSMTLETGDLALIQTELAGQHAPTNYVLPEVLKRKGLAGCGVVPWRSQKASMICLLTGKPLAGGEKSDLFLFVVERDSISNPPSAEAAKPEFAVVKKLATASWSSGDKTYLLATPGDEAAIRQYF